MNYISYSLYSLSCYRHNNVYLQKGKLGFALIKVIRTGSHNIILYDSNKTTLSNASVTNQLKVTVKSSNFISYFDDQRKYWSLYGAGNEIETVTELLKTLDVTIIKSDETDTNPPEPVKNTEVQSLKGHSEKPVESDTDSAVNRKTKASILNRMANMGHSVLPPNVIPVEKTSDSSDTNDTDYSIKAVRHKPVKGITKRSSMDKTLIDHQKIIDLHANMENPRIGPTTEIKNTSCFTSDQLVPLASTAIVYSPSGNDMNVFLSEQRISNSELRISMGRMTDKMDHIMHKIDKLELKDQNEGNASLNNNILQKLLQEYESKIKVYEELFQKMACDRPQNIPAPLNLQAIHKNEETLESRIAELENIVKKKDEAVLMLQNEVKILRDAKDKQSNILQMNISELEAELNTNKIVLKDLTEENIELSKASTSSDVVTKIKTVMNDTYQAIATNFENDENYPGAAIKKTIAMVIKKVTVSALNDS